ncbi:hypothetical protein GCM10028791_02030 [Echinicola sediminis]
MDIRPKHIVHKVSCELISHNSQNAHLLKDYLGDWLKTDLLPIIEQVLDTIDDHTGRMYLQVPELELVLKSPGPLFEGQNGKLNHPSSDQMLGQLKRQLTMQLQKALDKIDDVSDPNHTLFDALQVGHAKKTSSLSHLNREINTICHLLQNGSKPWWMGENEKAPLFFSNWNKKGAVKEILDHPIFIALLKHSAQNPSLRRRLVKQFTIQQNRMMYEQFVHQEYGLTVDKQLLNALETKIGITLKIPLWDFIWAIPNSAVLKDNLKQLISTVLEQLRNAPNNEKMAAQITLKKLIDWVKAIHQSPRNWLDEDIYMRLSGDRIIPKNEVKSLFQKGQKSRKNSADKDESLPYSDSKFESYSSISDTLTNQNHLSNEADHVESSSDDTGLEELEVGQAGLILLHPFLKELFLKTKLLTANNVFSDRERAVLLLHYLATKKESAFDHELIFEKFCCGMRVSTAVNRELVLSKELKSQAEELLKTVIGHWTSLKGTGVDTLRSAFLCRKGKLFLEGKYPKLILERKTQDILLEKLPWGISMVKFPWRKELLFVEW